MSSDRLLLEPPDDRDAASLFALAGGDDRDAVTEGLIWDGPNDVSETLTFVRSAQTDTFGESGFHWAIRDRTGDISGSERLAIGMISARPRGEPGRGDVGYWLGRPFWGMGIMREALTSVLDLCFTGLDMVKIEADVFTANSRSIRLAEGVGMTREGTVRRAHLKRGSWVDSHIYGLLREEWMVKRPNRA
jgi:RimJ/RimL family protein N-acetyltransferase